MVRNTKKGRKEVEEKLERNGKVPQEMGEYIAVTFIKSI